MLTKVFRFLSSLRLTVVLLLLFIVLVFIGTLAQVDLGIWDAQAKYFRSLFVYWSPASSSLKIPYFPGGYLLGSLLFINLLAAHFSRFTLSRKKIGIFLTHIGVVLLLAGQFITDMVQVESAMRIEEGQDLNYSESQRGTELVLIDSSSPDKDHVISIPEGRLEKEKEINSSELPVQIKVLQYYPNSEVEKKLTAQPGPATHGFGTNLDVRAKPLESNPDRRNLPSAILELSSAGKSLGTYVVADSFFDGAKQKAYVVELQDVEINGKKWSIGMRPQRYYLPFSLELERFSHDRYAGTDIPMNFSSKVKISNPSRNETREVLIYMNSPLRYGGQTFYQGGFSPDNDRRSRKISILQVVRNPGWLTPYLACSLVGLGLIIQFMTHLVGFVGKRKKA